MVSSKAKISDIDKANLKSYMPEYLRSKGINPSKHFRCLNPNHVDSVPSMKLKKNKTVCHCYGCSVDYDIFNLIGLDYSLTGFKEQFDKACEIFGYTPNNAAESDDSESKEKYKMEITVPVKNDHVIPEKDFVETIKNAALQFDNSPADEYLIKRRNISIEVAARFAAGYLPAFKSSKGELWQTLIIPTGDMLHSFTARNLNDDSENRYEKRGGNELFNVRELSSKTNNPLFVTEGEIDAMSIIEVGGEAVGLGSASNWTKFAEHLDEISPDRLIILSLDNDDAGKNASKKLSELLASKKKRFAVFNPYGSYKDANEALCNDPDGFKYRIQNAEQLIQTEKKEAYMASYSASGMLQRFIDSIYQSKYSKPISTGFSNFDKALGGGLYAGLYVIGAISSLGKTTFCLQIADQIAKSGRDVMIFTLEMSAEELISKSISRITAQTALEETGRYDFAKDARGITDGSRYDGYTEKEKNRIANGFKVYKSYSNHIIIHEEKKKDESDQIDAKNINDQIDVKYISDQVELHKTIIGNYPVVVIDYLQILKAVDPHMTDKQAVDFNVSALKRLSRNMPVIVISSMNRESYKVSGSGSARKGKVSFADFKESGGIEYGSDVVIGLQFSSAGESDYDEESEKTADIRQITAVILKNRNGKVYEKANFNYKACFNLFLERQTQY